ncbi:MAG: hypothetical protein EOP48_17535 [Sphingobacteriales bacterium]|nr:MAG: hypothetical protein EOP48_17535 [Sphingobacteriales bacterium]
MNKPTNEIEAEALGIFLCDNNGKDLSEDDLVVLKEIFRETEYPGLRHTIADTMIEAADESFYEDLILKIKETIHTKFIGPLIYVAENYYCEKDLQVFVDIIILKDDMSMLDAMFTIDAMEQDRIPPLERMYAINKLNAHLDSLKETEEKYELVKGIIDLLAGRK